MCNLLTQSPLKTFCWSDNFVHFFSKERIPNFHWLLFVLILMLLTSLLLPHCLTNWALPVDNLQASSVGFITLTADRQHDPSFWQATGVRLALTGQSVSTNRLAAVGVPGILTTAQGRVEIGCVCKEIFFQMILRNCNVCVAMHIRKSAKRFTEWAWKQVHSIVLVIFWGQKVTYTINMAVSTHEHTLLCVTWKKNVRPNSAILPHAWLPRRARGNLFNVQHLFTAHTLLHYRFLHCMRHSLDRASCH